jgi:hypothetical protein
MGNDHDEHQKNVGGVTLKSSAQTEAQDQYLLKRRLLLKPNRIC